jgi:two-component system response regulator YesN
MAILIVDDDNLLRETIKMFVSEVKQCPVDDAANGEVALQKLSQSKYDLMVTDWDMPVMGGKELVQRSIELYPDMKIVVFSGSHISGEDRIPFIQYLRKPNDHERLADIISG